MMNTRTLRRVKRKQKGKVRKCIRHYGMFGMSEKNIEYIREHYPDACCNCDTCECCAAEVRDELRKGSFETVRVEGINAQGVKVSEDIRVYGNNRSVSLNNFKVVTDVKT